MGQLELRGPGALAFAQRMLSNDLDRIGAGHAQYTLLLDEHGLPGRRPDRLPLRRRPPAAGGERLARRRRPRLAGGRPAGDEVAAGRPLRRDGDARPAGAAPRWRWSSCPSWRRSASPRREVCGVPAIVARTGYTGEPGVELMCAPSARASCGTRCVAAGATPCGPGRARHAAARGLLPAVRQRPVAGADGARGGPGLGLRAGRQGLRRRRGAARASARRAATTGWSRSA